MAEITVTATVDETLWRTAKDHLGGVEDSAVLTAALQALLASSPGTIPSTYAVPSPAAGPDGDQEVQLRVGT